MAANDPVSVSHLLSRSQIKTTPAVKHGLTDHVWSVREMLENVAEY